MKVTVCKGCKTRIEGSDTKTGKPACPICGGLNPDSGVPEEVEIADTVKCVYCKTEVPTSQDLPFLDAKHGTYYCGCRGWD